MSDRKLARKLHRRVHAVRLQRRLAGLPRIPEAGEPAAWTPQEDRQLGTDSDSTIARLLGRTELAVRARRFKLGKSLAEPLRRNWTPQEDKLLGTASDKDIAARIRRDPGTVADRRRALGISHFLGTGREWTFREERLRGTMPDRQLAGKLGRSLASVQNKRIKCKVPMRPHAKYRPWTEAEIALLGTMPDTDLARRIGRQVEEVHGDLGARLQDSGVRGSLTPGNNKGDPLRRRIAFPCRAMPSGQRLGARRLDVNKWSAKNAPAPAWTWLCLRRLGQLGREAGRVVGNGASAYANEA